MKSQNDVKWQGNLAGMSTVAYLGPAGTFTEAALHKLERAGAFAGAGHDAGAGITAVPVASPGEALRRVSAGEADYAVVAAESSVEGAVTATHDALVENPGLQIFAEATLNIQFSILTGTEEIAAKPQAITSIATHPVAYQQIRTWVENHLPNAEFIPASSNGEAARMVAQGHVDAAAAPDNAADLHGLARLAQGVADVSGAQTRFIALTAVSTDPVDTGAAADTTALQRSAAPRTGNDRTGIIFHVHNEPGALAGVLQEIAGHGVDLSRIESRPTRTGLGTYRFHVDMHGHIDDAPVAAAVAALEQRCEKVQFLGSWPKAQ